MILSESNLVKYVSRFIDNEFINDIELMEFVEILYSLTLPDFSSYYPLLMSPIYIKNSFGIKEKCDDESENSVIYRKYLIPKPKDIDYIAVADWDIRGSLSQYNRTNTQMGKNMMNLLFGQVSESSGITIRLEQPNYAVLDPYSYNPISFYVTMSRVRKLNEIDFNYHMLFRELYLIDIKSYLYNKYSFLTEGGIYEGVEIKINMDKYSGTEDRRKEILEKMQNDFYKDPSQYKLFLSGL